MYTCPDAHTPQSSASWTCGECNKPLAGKQSRLVALLTSSAVAAGLALLGWRGANLYAALCGCVAAFGVPAVLVDREDDHTAIFLSGLAVALFFLGLFVTGFFGSVSRAVLR